MSQRSGCSEDDEVLLDSLHELRLFTRRSRHAFWLPLLVFGVLICAAAPLYMWTTGPSSGNEIILHGPPPVKPWLYALGGNDRALGRDSTDATRGWNWLGVLLVGALVTGVWYSWYAKVVGIATRARVPVASWVGATVAFVVLAETPVSKEIVTWPTTFFATAALFLVAVGMIALTILERSRLLAVITAAFCAMTALCTFHDVVGMLLRLLSEFGLPPDREPYGTSGALVVVLPGLLLIAGALVTLRQDVNRR